MALKTKPSSSDLEEAHQRIKPYIHRTPVLTSASINALAGCDLFFKCENFQKIGAFKARGAMNAALSLSEEELECGLATHSSGNHAQAVARAAKILGVKSYIVMPGNASSVKVEGVRAYDADIFFCEPVPGAREKMLEDVVDKTGATVIHPFNNYDVIAGQATVAKELFEEITDLDFIVVPVGGGGLLSGTVLATQYFSPRTTVVAGEPEGADDAYRSMQSGEPEKSQGNTVADGLLTSLGTITFPIIYEGIKEIITVSDQAIVEAMRLIWERMKIIIEPSAAVPVAAILKKKEMFRGKKTGVILSGGNVDVEKVATLLKSKREKN